MSDEDSAGLDTGKSMRLLLLIVAHLIVFILIWAVWVSKELGEYAQGVITLILGKFLGYLDTMYAYEYNTTRASKVKDQTIATMAVAAGTGSGAGNAPVDSVPSVVIPGASPTNERK